MSTWPSSYVNNLPDSAFLIIEQGGEKDDTNRTTPRALRHFPVYDANGHLDLPHLADAIGRIPQASGWIGEGEKERLQRRARTMLADAHKTTHKRAVGLPAWAHGYIAHADQHEALGITGEPVAKAWKGDVMLGKRAAEMLRGLTLKTKDKVSKRVTKAVDKLLRVKVAEHNAATPPPRFAARASTLKAAYQRGVQAYAASARPCVKSAPQWGFARVGALLSYCKTGAFPHPSYTADLDLLPRTPLAKDELSTGDLAAGGVLAPEQGLKRTTFAGLPIVIDRPKGHVQTKTDAAGKELWSRTYKVDYGYIPSTLGGDSEELDVFLGSDPTAPNAWWVIQNDGAGTFDEYKVILGSNSEEEARQIYLDHVPEQFLGRMFETPVGALHALLGLEPTDLMKAIEPGYAFVASSDGTDLMTAHPWTTLGMAAPEAGDDDAPAVAPAVPMMLGAAAHEEMAAAIKAIMAVLPVGCTKVVTPLAPGAAAGGDDAVSLFSPLDPFVADPDTILMAAEEAKAALVELPESSKNVAALAKLGGVFKLAGAPGRVFVATYPVPRSPAVQPIDESEMLWAPEGEPPPLNESAPPPPAPPAEVGKAGTILQIGKAESAPTDERYTLGIVLVPDEADLQGDIYGKATIRRAADIYTTMYQNTAVQHNVKPADIDAFRDENPNLFNGAIRIVDTFVIPDEMGDVTINGQLVKAGTWLLGHRWLDDALWEDVKAGKFTGLSMGGFARRVALDGSELAPPPAPAAAT